MICYVCGNKINSNEFFYNRNDIGNAQRHAWHGLPGTRPYKMDKPTLKTAFEWASSFNLAIIRPTGFDPIKRGAPRVTDPITFEAFERYGKQLSTTKSLDDPQEQRPEPRYERGMTIGPFNRPR